MKKNDLGSVFIRAVLIMGVAFLLTVMLTDCTATWVSVEASEGTDVKVRSGHIPTIDADYSKKDTVE